MASRSSLLLLVSVLAVGRAQTPAQTEFWDQYLDKVYTKCDINPTDGELSISELEVFFQKLGMTEDYQERGGTNLMTEMNTDGVGGVAKPDLNDWLKSIEEDASWSEFFEKIMLGMTGISDSLSEGIGEQVDSITNAFGYLDVQFTIADNPEDLFLGERQALKTKLAQALGLDEESVLSTITAGSARRRLQTAAPPPGGTVEVSAYVADKAEQDAAWSRVESTLNSTSASTAFLGVNVNSLITISPGVIGQTFELDYTIPIIILSVAVVACAVTLIANKLCAKKGRAKVEQEYKGCCSTGCCSSYALKGWSMGVFLAVLFNLIAGLILFVAMGPVKSEVKTIIDEILKTKDLGGNVAEATKSLEGVLGILEVIQPYVDLLDVAVIVPAVLASVTLMIAALCGARDTKTRRCTKLFSCLSITLLVVCFVFYILFVVLAYAVTLDVVQAQILRVTSICSTTRPVLKQTIADATALSYIAETTPGVDPTKVEELKDGVETATAASDLFGKLCVAIDALFDAFADLFIPGACCVVAAAYSFYMIFGMYCAAACCKTKPKGMAVVKNDGDTVSV